MSKPRGQKAPRIGFLSVEYTWQWIQQVIGEGGRAVTRPTCSSGLAQCLLVLRGEKTPLVLLPGEKGDAAPRQRSVLSHSKL